MDLFRTTAARQTLLALAGLILAGPASADIYKCASADGQPVYQDSACPPGRELRNFQTDPATVSVVPFDLTPPVAPAADTSTPRQKPAGNDASAPAKRSARAKSNIPAGNATERKFLHPGMSVAEVLAKIGAPDIRSGRPDARGGGALWSYLPTDGDPGMITTVHLSSGNVTQIDRIPSR